MRLIDADKLNFLGQHYNKSQMKAILDFVDAQPTAYDVDKVVKELNEWTFNANIDVGDGTVMNHNLIVKNVAIDIVKTGATDESQT